MTRRLLLATFLAAFSKKLAAKFSIPIVRDLNDLPDGVPGILEYEPFGAWIKACGGSTTGPTYYAPAIGRRIMCLKTLWYGTDIPGPSSVWHSPYLELELSSLRDALKKPHPSIVWLTPDEIRREYAKPAPAKEPRP